MGHEPNFDFLDGRITPNTYSDYTSEQERSFEGEKKRCDASGVPYSKELKRFLELRKKFDDTPDRNEFNGDQPYKSH